MATTVLMYPTTKISGGFSDYGGTSPGILYDANSGTCRVYNGAVGTNIERWNHSSVNAGAKNFSNQYNYGHVSCYRNTYQDVVIMYCGDDNNVGHHWYWYGDGVSNNQAWDSCSAHLKTTVAAVAAQKLKMQTYSELGGNSYYCYELYWKTDCVLPGGKTAFALFITEWLGPLISVGLHEIPKLVAEIYALGLKQYRRFCWTPKVRSTLFFHPDEYLRIYRALREFRYPSYFFLAA